MTSQPNNQLFVVGSDLLKAVSVEEVQATCASLRELDLYRLPYASQDIDFPCFAVIKPKHDAPGFTREMYDRFARDGRIIIKNLTTDPDVAIVPTFYWTTNPKHPCDLTGDFNFTNLEATRQNAANFLVAVLASRNVVKTVKHSKMAKLGIGKNRYEYTTTLSIPTLLESDSDHAPTGRTVCPHLRRGHIRRQHYGPNRELIKQVWIAPVFVNADEKFVNSRKAYNMRGNCEVQQKEAA